MSITTRLPIARKAAQTDHAALEEIVVRRPCERDVPGLAALFSEMQAHYDRPVTI